MKNIFKRKMFFAILIVLIAIGNIAFASGTGGKGPEVTIKTVLINIISVITWIGYAIAIGVLIIIGIKYVMSGADEKAQIKGMLPKYLIGIALIVCCVSIAQVVVNIAGNNEAAEIIDTGLKL